MNVNVNAEHTFEQLARWRVMGLLEKCIRLVDLMNITGRKQANFV